MAERAAVPGLDGWLIVDKPRGPTSAAAVARVRSLARGAKAGHAGTLDPLATGVLPVAVGEATKTIPYMIEGPKRYRFGLRWGERRDTDDAEGAVVERSDMRPSAAAVVGALPAFVGRIEQVPPAFSAIRVQGERAYARARAGRPPTLAPRTIEVKSLRAVSVTDGEAAFTVECGKGTYIRALARDIARALGTVGHVHWLRRVAVGPFTEHDAIPLDNLRELGHGSAFTESLLPVDAALAGIPALQLAACEADRLRHGQRVLARGSASGKVRVVVGSRLVALAEVDADRIRPLRVFNM